MATSKRNEINKMNIERITFEFTETKTYTVVVSGDTGWDTPNTPEGLIEFVNEVTNRPSDFRDNFEKPETHEVKCDNYSIKEG